MLQAFALGRRDDGAVAHVVGAPPPGNSSCLFFVVCDGCLVGVCGYTFECGWFFLCHAYPLAYVVVVGRVVLLAG
eukprot:9287561-Pyramimonas_sp.AAC.1